MGLPPFEPAAAQDAARQLILVKSVPEYLNLAYACRHDLDQEMKQPWLVPAGYLTAAAGLLTRP
jgi:hypothetical protein